MNKKSIIILILGIVFLIGGIFSWKNRVKIKGLFIKEEQIELPQASKFKEIVEKESEEIIQETSLEELEDTVETQGIASPQDITSQPNESVEAIHELSQPEKEENLEKI
jgi:hypothetical protein